MTPISSRFYSAILRKPAFTLSFVLSKPKTSLPHKPVSGYRKGVLCGVSPKAEPDIMYLGADPGSGSESLEPVRQGSRTGQDAGVSLSCAGHQGPSSAGMD